MGVSGLLPLLKSIQKPTELKNFHGQVLGVDAYGWLHRAAYSCAVELGQGKPTNKYINAFMLRVRMLRHFGVKPYMVFDGDYLPSKAATEASREKNRTERKKMANELFKAGKSAQAAQEFQKCIDVTPEMASAVIQQLNKMDIPCVVAPYEADAQLVYLERQGIIDGILSDDSDLLVFGAKRLLTKLDQYGNCIEINRRDFCACREVSLTGWTDADFRRMAIMSGCDYLHGLPGVGLKTAYRLLRKSKSPERVVRLLQFDGKRVSENYLTQFYQAELTFLHQWVFCPRKNEVVHLSELDGSRTAAEMPFIGAHVAPELSRAIARGDVNPITKAPITISSATPSKRRHSQTTATAVTPSPLPLKPIKSYFKGDSRIPMGEMDPNCFSVDPQRVSQITEGGLVPRVFPLPRPYVEPSSQPDANGTPRRPTSIGTRTSPRLQRRRTEPISDMLSRVSNTPAASRRMSTNPVTRSPFGHKSQPDSASRPPKKARLCNEADEKDGSPKNSKFFPKTKAPGSPTRSKSDAYLLSDDSVEEALRNLPDIDEWKSSKPAYKRTKSITVFEETSQETSQETSLSAAQGTSQETSQETIPDTEPSTMRLSQQEQSDSDLLSSAEFSMPPPKSTRFLSRLSVTPSRPNLGRFSYSSKSSATPASAMSVQSSVFSTGPTPSTGPSTAGTRSTPLQRLRAKALNAPMSPKLPSPRARGVGNRKGFQSGLPVNPSFVPLPRVDLKEVEALNKPCGSEDQIIPDSDGEDEVEDEMDAPAKRLNLSRFAFS